MTEAEYITVSNIQKLRTMETILRDVLHDKDATWGVSTAQIQSAGTVLTGIIRAMRRRMPKLEEAK